MSRIEDGGAVEAGRDIWEVSNQLAGYVDERTPQDLCDFLIRESKAAADLAAEITRLRAENAGMREALKPFALERSTLDLSRYDDENQVEVRYPPVGRHQRIPVGRVTIGDLRRARAALSKASQAEGQTR